MALFSRKSRELSAAFGTWRRTTASLSGALLLALWGQWVAASDAAVQRALRAETDQVLAAGGGAVDGISIANPRLLADFYAARNFAPAWTAAGRAAALLGVVRTIERDGLRPADYRPARIEGLQSRADDTIDAAVAPRELAVRDILLSDALARLVSHLRYGKANPASPLATAGRATEGSAVSLAWTALTADLLTIAEAESLDAAIAAARPATAQYRGLRAALADHRRIAGAGGWPLVTEGAVLRPGDRDPRIGELRRRLARSGDFPGPQPAGSGQRFDAPLVASVLRFQARHGLAVDGLVGPATLRALNVPVAERIDQLRVNLERARWAARDASDDYLLVNLPAFRADLVFDGELAWTTRVVIGEREQQTPDICSTLKYVVFNPTWTLPHRIASEEMLPRIQEDPQFLANGGYELFDGDGEPVDPRAVDWSTVTRDNFPFTLMQRAGPANQLGQVKFVFPNEYDVTLHDTPARHLFEFAERAASHGCVRVDNPLALAAQLLRADGWTRAGIDAQVRSRETRTVFLDEPLPVFLRYRTAEIGNTGIVHFFNDVYARDAAVLAALDAGPAGMAPDGQPR